MCWHPIVAAVVAMERCAAAWKASNCCLWDKIHGRSGKGALCAALCATFEKHVACI
jgi:hypothetical protein